MRQDEMIAKIKRGETFSAYADDQSFFIAIDEWVPFICTALHNGSNLRRPLREKILLSKTERWHEEDPCTGQFISSLPIRIIAYDSRYEYDLNRNPKACIYQEAWGKKIWNSELNEHEIAGSLAKHHRFYEVLTCLVKYIEEKYNGAVVYDIHSFNYKRYDYETCVFNIGCEKIHTKFKKDIEQWQNILNDVDISGVKATCQLNQVFQGRGYLLENLSTNFKKTLVLATEIKKIYCDEETGDEFPKIIDAISKGLKEAIVSHAKLFSNSKTKIFVRRKHSLLSSRISHQTLEVDHGLYKICHNFELLDNIAPVNIASEKKKFLNNPSKYQLSFRYKPLKFNLKSIQSSLHSLPVASIPDVDLQELYHDAIEAQCKQIEMLSYRGSKRFFYQSLAYFGEPQEDEISTANWLLGCPDHPETIEPFVTMNAEEVKGRFEEYCKSTGLFCRIEIYRNMAAKAMFIPSKNMLKINSTGQFTKREVQALFHHEIGIHCLTTLNARLQPLKILQMGFPVYTYTQEGLAILAEYLSGFFSLERLKELALRVLAVRSLVAEKSFNETYQLLLDEYNTPENKAFEITLRVYRGGGLTKDYLYLKGFRELLNSYHSNPRTKDLLVGKTSIEKLPLISELIDREILLPAKHVPDVFVHSKSSDSILTFIINGISIKKSSIGRIPSALEKTMGF